MKALNPKVQMPPAPAGIVYKYEPGEYPPCVSISTTLNASLTPAEIVWLLLTLLVAWNAYWVLCDKALEEVINEFPNAEFFSDAIMELTDFDSVICHYPLEVWNGKDSGTIHMHGHTVFSHKTDLKIQNRFNVCSDFWGFTPINYLTLKDFING